MLAKTTALTGLACLCFLSLAIVVLWDADFYAARDRWEHMKIAWFSKWPENNKFRLLRGQDMVVCHWGNNGTIGICFLKKKSDSDTDGETNVD